VPKWTGARLADWPFTPTREWRGISAAASDTVRKRSGKGQLFMSATTLHEGETRGPGVIPARRGPLTVTSNGGSGHRPGNGTGHGPGKGSGQGPTHQDEAFTIRSILAPLFAIVIGTFMAILDTTVVNVALPTLGRVFNADLRVLQWVITAYMLAQAAVIPLAGWFSDHFGAKRVYLTAITLFTAGSVLCALAPSAELLVVFRVLQGLGGGMLMPVGMSFLYRLAPPDKRGAVMGGFGVPMLLAPATGPVLSGWLLQYADWRLIFLINLPVGILGLLVGLRALPVLPALRAAGKLDVLGIVLGPLGFASLSYGIAESTNAGWTGVSTLTGITVGVVALVAFLIRELSVEHPLLELRVFRSRDFTLGIMTQWLLMGAIFGSFFLIPVFLQQVRGYGPFETGLATLPQALVAALFMPIGGRLFDKFGARPLVVPGLILATTSLWLLSGFSASTTAADLRLPLALMGAGMGLMMMPLGTHILNSAPRHLVSRVTSLTGALQNVVVSLAIASYATYLQGQIAFHLAEARAAAGAAGAAAGAAGGGAPAGGFAPEGLSRAAGQLPPALAGAFAASFGDTYRVAMVVAALGIVLALTLRRPRPAPSPAGSPAPVPSVESEPVAMGVG
jgi:EmrB/QacA subfamily drug resistance transporter